MRHVSHDRFKARFTRKAISRPKSQVAILKDNQQSTRHRANIEQTDGPLKRISVEIAVIVSRIAVSDQILHKPFEAVVIDCRPVDAIVNVLVEVPRAGDCGERACVDVRLTIGAPFLPFIRFKP